MKMRTSLRTATIVLITLSLPIMALFAVVSLASEASAAVPTMQPFAAILARPTIDPQPQTKAPIVIAAVAPASFDGDLRDLSPLKQAVDPNAPVREAAPPREPKQFSAQQDTFAPQPLDPNVQRDRGERDMPTPSVTFNGINNFDNAAVFGGGVLPPDPNGDVGRNHYIQMVNILFAIYDKSGNRLVDPTPLSNLFGAGATGTPCDDQDQGDPIVVYDPLADRWLMSQFGFDVDAGSNPIPPYYECIAVSKTPDPVTGGWWLYAIPAPGPIFPDYPKLAVWPDAYYMTTNMFPDDIFAPVFSAAWALERDKMLAGQPAQAVYFALDPSYFSLLAANLRGDAPPANSPAFILTANTPGTLNFWKFSVDWSNPLSSTLAGPTALVVNAFERACPGNRSCVPQPGTSVGLDSLSHRMMHWLQYRRVGNTESLWATHTITQSGKTAIRWYEIRLQRGGGLITPTVYQQSTFNPADGVWRWMPSIAADRAGNVAIGYSASSSSIFPGIRYNGRLATDTLNLLPQGEFTMTTGGGSQTHSASRWGDYSAMSVDPVDDCTFWYTTEYLTATSVLNWATRIGAFKFPSCTPLPPVGYITGTVYNSVTLARIAYAPVSAVNQALTRTYSTAADASGAYTLTVLPGTYTVTAGSVLPGYPVPGSVAGIAVSSGVTTTAHVGLQPYPNLIEAAVALVDPPPNNGNGYAEPGESHLRLFEGISNTGVVTATGVTAQLVALTPGVTVVTPTAAYANIIPGARVTNTTPFGFSIDGGVTCNTPLGFRKIITTNQAIFTTTFSLNAGVPPAGYASADVPKTIPDANPAGASSVVTVTDVFTISDVNVSLSITHTWDADLDIYLISPAGITVELSTGNGFNGHNYIGTSFDDEAATSITDGSAPFSGSFQPEGLLAAFDGSNAQGVWKLRVFDTFTQDTGTLLTWTLTLQRLQCDFAVPDLSVADTTFTESGGTSDGDGLIEPGENSINLDVALANTGAITATNVSGTLAPQTPGVTMNTGSSAYLNIGVGATQTNATHFNFAVSPGVTCGIPLQFQIAAASDQGTFYHTFSLPSGSVPIPAIALTNTIENGASGWTTGGSGGAWSITTELSKSPTHSWTDSSGGNYLDGTSAWLQSPALDLSAYDSVTMTFWHIYSLEADYDFGYIEYSIDGGASWNPTPLAAFTGAQIAWGQATLNLSVLVHQPNARVRFRLFSDIAVTDDGWHVDDIQILGGRRYCSTSTLYLPVTLKIYP